jgi:hypothetical protein
VHLWYFWNYLRFIVFKEGKTLDLKIKASVKMLVPKTPQEILVFNEMAQSYRCFIRNFAFIMPPIAKLFRIAKMFEWIVKCQTTWEDIMNQYIQAPIHINPN